MSGWHFVRDHSLAAFFAVALLAVLLYKPLTQSSPVVERSRFMGTIVMITKSGADLNGRAALYRYQIRPSDGGQMIFAQSHLQLGGGDMVPVERVVRRNGNITYDIMASGRP